MQNWATWRNSLYFILPPLSFLVKDIIATVAVLSREPGITAQAVFFYSVALLPGSLVVSNGKAPFVNTAVGLFLGLMLFLRICIRRKAMHESRPTEEF